MKRFTYDVDQSVEEAWVGFGGQKRDWSYATSSRRDADSLVRERRDWWVRTGFKAKRAHDAEYRIFDLLGNKVATISVNQTENW